MEGKYYNRKNRSTAVAIYIAVFFSYLAISRVVPLTYAMTDRVDTLLSAAMAGFGGLLLLQDVLTDRCLFKAKDIWVLAGFVVVLGISSLLNRQYGLTDNIKAMVWFCIHFFLFYPMIPRFGSETGKKILLRLLLGLGILWTLCVSVSIAQYIFQIGFHAPMHEYVHKRQGFIENRLFGLFSDPNAAALVCLCMILSICYWLETSHWKFRWIPGILGIGLHFSYIILSGSRTVVICLLIAAAIKTGFMVWNFCRMRKFHPAVNLISVVAGMLIFCTLFTGVYNVSKDTLSHLPVLAEGHRSHRIVAMLSGNHLRPVKPPQPTQPDSPIPELTEPGESCPLESTAEPDLTEPFDADSVFDREDVREDNILNNRQSIWRGYFRSLHGSKWIFGLSPRNAVPYIAEHYPDNYIAQTGYIAHSDYIAVIAYTGLAGVLAFALFGILSLVSVIRKLHAAGRCSSFYLLCVSMLCAMGVFAMSYMDILFCNTLTGFLFWLLVSVVRHWEEPAESGKEAA